MKEKIVPELWGVALALVLVGWAISTYFELPLAALILAISGAVIAGAFAILLLARRVPPS